MGAGGGVDGGGLASGEWSVKRGTRILFLLSQSLERPSGVGRYWPLSRELAAMGHQVTVLALHPDWRNLAQRRFTRDGVEVRYVGQMHIRQNAAGKSYFHPLALLGVVAMSTLRLTWCGLRTPADVVVVGKAQPMNGLAGAICHWLRRIPLHLDCDDYEAGSNRFAGRWQRRVVAWFEDRLPRWATSLSVNTRFMQRRIQSLGVPADRVRLLPNGVDVERFSVAAADQIDRLRMELGLNGGRCVAYIGSLSLTNHAVDVLLDAFNILSQSLPDVKLILVGGGEDFEVLHGKVEALKLVDGVHFVGPVPSARVPLYYRLADVTVDPVRDDETARARCPLKLFESWASGVPFVTADVGDRREYLGNDEAGVLVAPGNPQALANGLLAVLTDAPLAARLAAAGRERAAAYHWDRLAATFAESWGGVARA